MKVKLPIGIYLAFLAAFLWSTGGIGIKVLSLDGLEVSALRALFSALVLAPFFRPQNISWNFKLLGFILSFTYMCTSFVISTKLTTAANAIALQYTAVFWVFIIDEVPALKRFPKEKILPLVIVLIGIWFYMIEPDTGTNVLGNIIGLSSGFAFGLVAVFLKRLAAPDGKSVVFLANFVTFIILFAIMGFKIPVFENAVFEIGILFYLGVFQIALSYIIFNKALRTVSALTGNFVALLEPVLNPIWVYFILGEFPTFHGIIGWICIMASVVIYLLTLNSGNNIKNTRK